MKPALVQCHDAGQQAAFIAQRALELRDEGVGLDKIAVLYRSHFHALELQLELTRQQIPFSITSGMRFFEQAHIKDATAYLKFVANPRDEISFKRLVQLLPGIAAKGADKLWQSFQIEFQKPKSSTPVAVALQDSIARVPKKAVLNWAQFTATIAQLEDKAVRKSAAKMLRLVMDAGYDDYLKEDVRELRAAAGRNPGTRGIRFSVWQCRGISHTTRVAHECRGEDDNAAKTTRKNSNSQPSIRRRAWSSTPCL